MVCVWFPTSTFKLKVELNGSRRSFLCVTLTRLKTRLVENGQTGLRMISDLSTQLEYRA